MDGIGEVKEAELPECLHVIHAGYEPVAVRFGLTNDNCPYRGRASLPLEVLEEEFTSGIKMYGYRKENTVVGFLSLNIEKTELRINDVVVLPEFWNQGVGTALLEYAKAKAAEQNISKVSLGMIDDNQKLKKWYEKNGFVTVGYKQYPGAPFLAGYMEWARP